MDKQLECSISTCGRKSNTPFHLIGQARIKWCHHHVVFSFVQQNKSPPLLKRLLLTNKWLDTIHTEAAPRQGLLLCRHRFSMANIRCLLQKYVCTSDLQPHYHLVYFFGTPHILFSCTVIKICVAKLRDIYIIMKRIPLSILVWI